VKSYCDDRAEDSTRFWLGIAGLIIMLSMPPSAIAAQGGSRLQEISETAVWSPREGLWEEIQEACGANSSSVEMKCVGTRMKKAGASLDAIEFTKRLKGEAYLSAFQESGKVDVGSITYPILNDPNSTAAVLLNGKPLVFRIWEHVQNLDLKRAKEFPGKSRQFPKLELFPMSSVENVESLQGGGQRFTMSFLLLNGCRGCDIAGKADIALEFNRDGGFLRAVLLRLRD
jgi:hypothetical protein